MQTALRETNEEVGVDISKVTIIGKLTELLFLPAITSFNHLLDLLLLLRIFPLNPKKWHKSLKIPFN